MVGMDFLGPISPACSVTGARYMLLVIDYFIRFVWAKAYADATNVEVIDMYENHISPIFGWPRGVYSDNGSHFVNQYVEALFSTHGVSHFTGPISHPSSTGMLERAVMEMLSIIAKKCLLRRSNSAWSLDVRENVLDMITKGTKIHGYLPAQLMLGFEPQKYHFDANPVPLPTPGQEDDLPPHQAQIFAAIRDENRLLSMEAASYTYYVRGIRQRKQRLPQPGDLVLIRNHAVDQ